MEQYIKKSALVAEIESLKSAAETMLTGKTDLSYWKAQKYLCERFLSFLNTLEVKEVNLEEYYHKFLQKEWFGNSHVRTVSEMMAFTAKHFFELGMAVGNKAQEGE